LVFDGGSDGESESHEDSDDGDDDQEFDERESGAGGGEATHEDFLEHFGFYAQANWLHFKRGAREYLSVWFLGADF
jgi:hypothetical protein